DPKAKERFLRGADTDRPEVQEVLVHELTHAVQDQNFGISRPKLDKKEDDSALGFLTMVEGDAVRIQQRFHQSLSKDDQRRVDAYMAAQSSSATAGVPQFLVESLSFPYVVGPAFTTRLVQVGGQARLDEAFRHPPTTTAQLLHPDLFLAGEGPRSGGGPRASQGSRSPEGRRSCSPRAASARGSARRGRAGGQRACCGTRGSGSGTGRTPRRSRRRPTRSR